MEWEHTTDKAWQIQVERNIAWVDLEQRQKSLVEKIARDPRQAFLLCSEPQPTFTAGISAQPSDLLWSEERRSRQGVRVVAASRGGQWTYHGPGQIVLFPTFHLEQFGYHRRAVHRVMGDLRQAMDEYLRHSLKHVTEVRDRPFGIYVGGKKLVSFGMAVHRGITSHGLALYYSDQNEFFRGIHPCGVSQGEVTSLTELGTQLSWETVAFQMIETVKKGLKSRKKWLGC